MARKTALTQDALVALGADKLARLVLDEAGRNSPFKRLVSAAIAGAKGPDAIAAVLDRRLEALERARGFIDWDKRKAFAADLHSVLTIITDELAPADPALAVERLLRFIAGAEGVYERVDDSGGSLQDIYRIAVEAMPQLAGKLAEPDRAALAVRLVPLLLDDGHGLIESLFEVLLPLLAPVTLPQLDKGLAVAAETIAPAAQHDRSWERRLRLERVIRARQAVADARQDVDAYIALAQSRAAPSLDGLAIAERLLAAGRLSEALAWVRQPARPGLRVMTAEYLADETGGYDHSQEQRARLEIRILEAMGERDQAQVLRWRTFEEALEAEILQEYIAGLPDFAEYEVLDRAFAHAASHPQRYNALAFFLAWPRLDLAAALVLARPAAWDGRHYGALAPAAAALEESDPVAASVLYRALLDDILSRARASAYRHAAGYLARLDEIAARFEDRPGVADPKTYRDELKRKHGRKSGFWSLVEAPRTSRC